tara:strand:- start:57 stop:830 length:774 start_codon:yes stop_codon:yes gene_type:complete
MEKMKNSTYWIYNKYSIHSALFNLERKIIDFVVEKKRKAFYEKLLKEVNTNRSKKIKVREVNKKYILKKIGPLAKYQGVAMLVEVIKSKIFNTDSLSHIKKDTILILDKINDPNNLGAIMRTSIAFGVKDIIVSKHTIPNESSYISSIASGALDKINIYETTNLVNAINVLKKNEWWVIGLESKNLPECLNIKEKKFDFIRKAIVIGSESHGIRDLVRKSCDVLTRIYIRENSSNSINVVQATTIALYELCSESKNK